MMKLVVLAILMTESYGSIPFLFKNEWIHHHKKISIITPNPCDNFYEYSCAKWKNETTKPEFEPYWNQFISVSYQINKKIQNILEDPVQFGILGEARRFYQTCVKFEEKENIYFRDLQVLLEWYYIKWINGQKEINWIGEIMDIAKSLNIHPILKFHVNIDYKNPRQYVLYIEPGSLIFPSNILLNTQIYQNEINAYMRWISKTMRHIFNGKHISPIKIVEFEVHLAKLMSNKLIMERSRINNVSDRFNFDLKHFMNNNLFSNTTRIKNDDLIVIKDSEYFNSVCSLLKKIDREVIANYLIWYIAKDFSRDTTKYMKNLNFLIDKSVLGVHEDIPRDFECVNKVMDNFEYALLPTYLDSYFDDNTRRDIEDMTDNIKDNFHNLLTNNTWLSEETKVLSVDKIRNMRFIIGYPEWVQNISLNGQYYFDVKNLSDNHLFNILKIKRFKANQNLQLIGQIVEKPIWPSNIFDVNAFYSILQNLVFIPLGLLQKPFYNSQWPKIFNYGALGSLIGHEISHSLDTTGRRANSNGVISKWWSSQDISKYKRKMRCFEQPYGKKGVTNTLATGENIADNIGLDISYRGYAETHYYDLDEVFWGYEDKKKFFIQYSQMWCELSNKRELFNDEHTTAEIRVNQAVFNNKYFNEIFKCNNPEKNLCKLW